VYRHLGPKTHWTKTFRHHVFGAEVSHIFALVPKCSLDTSAPLGQFSAKVHETLRTQNKNRPVLCVC